ncbi:MAG TPA: nucleotidyltransferase family protein, partial [Myxococcota bacterium]|nr:nucleotidyltransferase family protein [Myxococcota bacterium]
MQAVLLAGGKGTRLRPYTTVLPKPLMPIGDQPILEILIRQLQRAGFDDLVLAAGPHHELFRTFFGNGERWGVRLRYSVEPRPLGTAAPLRLIEGLDEDFLLLNGDILTDLPFAGLMELHRQRGADLTIATSERSVFIDYGTLHTDAAGRLTAFEEKPTLRYRVSMGVYAVRRGALELLPGDRPFDFPDWVLALHHGGRPVWTFPWA